MNIPVAGRVLPGQINSLYAQRSVVIVAQPIQDKTSKRKIRVIFAITITTEVSMPFSTIIDMYFFKLPFISLNVVT